jgi:hypothetical protein
VNTKAKRHIISLSIIAVILFLYFLVFINLKFILEALSQKGTVGEEFMIRVKGVLYILVCIAVFSVIFVTIILTIKKKLISLLKSLKVIRISENLKNVFPYLIIFVLLSYIVVSVIIIILTSDIGTDEATYVYAARYFFEHGKFLIRLDNDVMFVLRDMFGQSIIVILLKPIINYSVTFLRLITAVHSALLLCFIVFILNGRNKIEMAVSLLLFASFPGFLFLSGTSYGENISLLYLFLSLFLFEKYLKRKNNFTFIVSSFLLAIALLTKSQLLIIISGVMLIIIVTEFLSDRDCKVYIKHIILIIAAYGIVSVIYYLNLFSLGEIKNLIATYYTQSVANAVSFQGLITILVNLERFFNFQTIFFFIFVIVYYVTRKTKIEYTEKFIFLIVIVNMLWFVFMRGNNYRFMYFAQFGLIYLSIKPISAILKDSSKVFQRSFIVIFLIMFLIIGIAQNLKLSITGVGNDFLLYLNGNNPFKDNHIYVHNDDQAVFYNKVKEIIPENEVIFFIGAEGEIMAHLNNRYMKFTDENLIMYKEIKFVVRTAVNDEIEINQNYNSFLENKCDIVLRTGNYTLYKIK